MAAPPPGRWASFWDREVTRADWRLGSMVASAAQFPLLVVVLLFEHALANALYGAFKAGAVLGPLDGLGRLSLRWSACVISVLVVAAIGFASIWAGVAARGARPAVRQLLILEGRLTLLVQLVLVPIVARGHESLWAVVYDFSAIPGLSWAAAVGHGFLLLVVWRSWTRRIRWTLRNIEHGWERQAQGLEANLRANPDDVGARLRLANHCTNIGDYRRARRLLDGTPGDGVEVQLARSRLAVRRRRWGEAISAADAGLATPQLEDEARQRLTANRGVALVQLKRPAEALEAFAAVGPPQADQPSMRFEAALARTAAGDPSGGQAELRALADDLPPRDPLRRHIELRLQGRYRRGFEPLGILVQRLWPSVIADHRAQVLAGVAEEETPTGS